MPIPTPRPAWKRFLDSELPFDIFSAAASVGASASGAYRFWTTDPRVDPHAGTWALGLAVGAALALLSQFGKAAWKWRRDRKASALHDLAGCLHTLAAVLEAGNDRTTLGLRATIWVPSTDGRDLIQALDYVGDQRKKRTLGRTSPTSVGAIGLAFRDRKTVCASRVSENYDEFLAFMVSKYGYSEDVARTLDPATMSWLAMPLVGRDDKVEAVLYIDCKQPSYFDNPALNVIALAAAGIAYYVGLRYS